MKGSQFDLLQRYVAEIELTVHKAKSCGKLDESDIENVRCEIERVRKLTAHIDSQIKGLGHGIRPAPEPIFDEDEFEYKKSA